MKINATRIEMMLAENGLTKTDFAALCGISRQSISTIVRRGTCEPKTASKMALGLGVNLGEIIKEEV